MKRTSYIGPGGEPCMLIKCAWCDFGYAGPAYRGGETLFGEIEERHQCQR